MKNFTTYTPNEFFDCFGRFAFFKTLEEGRTESVDLSGCVETYDLQHDGDDFATVAYWMAEYDSDINEFTGYVVIDGYEREATFADDGEAFDWYIERREADRTDCEYQRWEEYSLGW